ncbi:MAG: redoxin domain-containing protein, partial [Dehalococcoidia bacterium]
MHNRFVLKTIGFALGVSLVSVAFVVGCGDATVVDEPAVQSSASGVLPPTTTPTPPANEFPIVGQPERFRLEDLSLVGIDGWINSEPLEISKLSDSNRMVLLDFWTYTCVNCIRTFPYLKAWHDTYAEHGLTIIGVHSPEFEFEKPIDNVRAAVERFELEYPVANDSEKQTWDKYGNHFWPSKYLLTTSGEVVLRHFGEGGYSEFEETIRAELERTGTDLTGVARVSVTGPDRSTNAHTITRELYGGYSNGYLSDGLYAGQDAYYESPDTAVVYVDDGTRRHGQFFLDGEWINNSSAIVSAKAKSASSAQFAFEFFATSVNAVLGAEFAALDVTVELDGQPLAPEQAGTDVTWNDAGESVV